jgi:tetratricopeptide (TPR) repeat protein
MSEHATGMAPRPKIARAERPLSDGPWFAIFLLFAATVLAYVPALRSGFIWDDDYYITGNLNLRSLQGLWNIWTKVGKWHGGTVQYYPLTFSAFWIQYHLWQLRPWGYHLVNVLLHALNAALVWRLLRRLRVPGALLAALIFAVHPVLVESVAWSTELKNILSGFFYLLSMSCLLRFFGIEESRAGGKAENIPWRWYFLAFLFFTCALGSKSVTSTLPAAVLLILWWKTGSLRWRDALLLAPLLVLGAYAGAMTAHVEKFEVGAIGKDWTLTFLQRVFLAGRALWFYAGKLAWPNRLTFIYPRWVIDPTIWWQALFPLSALAVIAALWRLRDKIGRGPLTAVLFFAGTLTPALGFVDIYPMRYSYVADHFQYLASLGLITLFSALAANATRPVTVAMLLALGFLTWRQCAIYRSLESLWIDTIEKNPLSWIAHTNLGVLLVDQGRIPEAIDHYRRALEANRDFAEAQSNWGVALHAQGRNEEALAHLREAVRLDPISGAVRNYAAAVDDLGLIAMREGRTDDAIARFQEAVHIEPAFAQAHNDLAKAWEGKGRADLAVSELNTAIRLEPGYFDAQGNLGMIMARQGRLDEAIAHFREALRTTPESAEIQAGPGGRVTIKLWFAMVNQNLGLVLIRQDKSEEAILHFREALRLMPDYADARHSLSLALSELENRAITHATGARPVTQSMPKPR